MVYIVLVICCYMPIDIIRFLKYLWVAAYIIFIQFTRLILKHIWGELPLKPRGLKKIVYDLFSDLPNIHKKFHENWLSRFGGIE